MDETTQWINGPVEHKLVNGLSGDPVLYSFFLKSGEAVLFDLGQLNALSNKEILKVRQIFVSHTHMDHFIGFERLLRVNVPHFRCLEICGPSGIAKNVQAKLRGYLWNLIDADQLRFLIHELDEQGEVSHFRLTNTDNFALNSSEPPEPITKASVRPLPKKPGAFLTNLGDSSRIEGVCLDHKTPVVAYICQSPLRFSVKTDELERLNLKPGPWIKELQTLYAAQKYQDSITVGSKTWQVSSLGAEILSHAAPRTIGYITDIQLSWENLERLLPVFEDVETLVCEANFSDKDFLKAYDKYHLSTRQAALIAAYLKVDQFKIFHISNLYKGNHDLHLKEASDYFQKFRCLDQDGLAEAINIELNRPR